MDTNLITDDNKMLLMMIDTLNNMGMKVATEVVEQLLQGVVILSLRRQGIELVGADGGVNIEGAPGGLIHCKNEHEFNATMKTLVDGQEAVMYKGFALLMRQATVAYENGMEFTVQTTVALAGVLVELELELAGESFKKVDGGWTLGDGRLMNLAGVIQK